MLTPCRVTQGVPARPGLCVRARRGDGLGIEYLSVVGQTPAGFPPPEATCNVAETRRVLGWEAEGNLEQWRAGSSSKL